MNEQEFDRCPSCGSPPKMGLRCHPKWSVRVGIITRQEDGGMPELVAYYAHDEASAKVLYDTFRNDPMSDVLSFERWNGEGWVEVRP